MVKEVVNVLQPFFSLISCGVLLIQHPTLSKKRSHTYENMHMNQNLQKNHTHENMHK
jgi:hypothetical protein